MSEHHIRAGPHHFRDESSMPIRTTNPFRAMSPLANPHKNPYVARLFTLQDSGDLPVYHGSALAHWVGRWRELFQSRLPEASRESRLIVEIGSHYGKTLSEMAASHPDSLFIGFDITFKRVIKAAERAQRAQIRNMITALANASGIDQLFSPSELDGIVVFYPDPWLKQRKAKNRLLNADFCKAAATRLKPGGFFWLKTDQQEYFNHASEGLLAAGLTPVDSIQPFGCTDFSSSFETLFKSQNLPVWSQRFVKPLLSSAQ